MNDVDMVRALRADAPWPSGDQLAEGRARLRTDMGREHRSRRPAVVIAGITAAAAVAAGIVLLPASRNVTPAARPAGSHQPAQLLSVSVVLGNAAAAAERRPAVQPGPHQWVYVKAVKAGPAGRVIMEGWTTFDGAQSADIEHGRLVVLPYGSAQDGVSDATPQGAAKYLRSLPASPKALLAVIYRRVDAEPRDRWAVPGNHDTEAFSILMTLLDNAPAGVPPAVQADVFRAAALIPGVRVSKAAAALVTQSFKARPSRPAGSMKTMAFMGRPVKSISRTWSRRSAASAPASPRRSMSSSPTMPVNMCPLSMNARPPNIFRSVISPSMPATISRNRPARVWS
jgi:hypothetical protein